ncbi:MAG: DUF2993 domain-containing protein [Firmicutes bacterium]|nr:DUF2993 domain-containing protein [Bacillota bacterium]
MTAPGARSRLAGAALFAACLALGVEFLVPPLAGSVAAAALAPSFGPGAEVRVDVRGSGFRLLEGRAEEVRVEARRAVVGGLPVSQLSGSLYGVRLDPLSPWRGGRPALRAVTRSRATFRISQGDIARWLAERGARARAAGQDGWFEAPSVTIGDGWIEVRGTAHYLGAALPVAARGRIVAEAQESALAFRFDELTVGGRAVPAALANAVFQLLGGGARVQFNLGSLPLQVTGVELSSGWATVTAAGGAWAAPSGATAAAPLGRAVL